MEPRALPESMRDLAADLLDRPAPEGARWIALVRLHELNLARARLDAPGDDEALHDFRVALRRLRSVARAYGDVLRDSVSRPMRRRLARLARAASASRDAEVHLHWLDARRAGLEVADGPGANFIEQRLKRDRRAGDRELRRELEGHFSDVSGRLHRRLLRYRVIRSLGDDHALSPARELLAGTLRRQADALRAHLDAPYTIADARALHRCRIAAKRLRYGLEPIAEGRFAPPAMRRTAAAAITQLRTLQDQLGQIRDAHVFGHWLAEQAAADAARRARRRVDMVGVAGSARPPAAPLDVTVHPMLVGLQRQLRDEAERSFRAINGAASKRRAARMLVAVGALADRLASVAPAAVAAAAPRFPTPNPRRTLPGE